jgi:hypothetical protein
MEELLKQAEQLVGRPIEVDKTSDGQFVVLWMNLNQSPPPKGKTPEEAVKNFIDYAAAMPKENTDEQ